MLSLHPGADMAVAVAVAAVATAAGARLRRLARIGLPPGLRLPADFIAGCWLLASAVLALGLLHAWNRWTLWAAVIALAAAGRWRRTGWRWSALAAPALGSLVALPVALTRPFFYDALVYHLGLPWQGLLEGGLRAHPEDLFSTFPPLAQLLAAVPLSVGCDRAPALLHWASFIAAGAAAAALARTLGAPKWGAVLAGACVPLLPGDALVPGLPAAEGYALVGMLAAAAAALGHGRGRTTAAISGLLAGAAVASRLQALAWSTMIVGIVVVRARERWRSGAAALAGVAVGGAPWWLKNAVLIGQPFAPVGWDREGLGALWRDAGVLLGRGATFTAAFHQLVGTLAPHAAYLLPLALASCLALTRSGDRRPRLAAALAAGAVLAWWVTGTVPRFLVPASAVLLALAASAAQRGPWGRWAAALSLSTAAAAGVAVNGRALSRIEGITSLRVGPAWVANDPRPAFAAARALPRSARVLFVGEARGFGFPRRFVTPSPYDVSPLRSVLETSASPAAACARLRAMGYTDVLVNWGELSRLANGYPVAPWRDVAGWRRWTAFIAWLGPPVVEASPVQIFALPAGSASV